jgi:hypothetical protein
MTQESNLLQRTLHQKGEKKHFWWKNSEALADKQNNWSEQKKVRTDVNRKKKHNNDPRAYVRIYACSIGQAEFLKLMGKERWHI